MRGGRPFRSGTLGKAFRIEGRRAFCEFIALFQKLNSPNRLPFAGTLPASVPAWQMIADLKTAVPAMAGQAKNARSLFGDFYGARP